MSPQLKKRKPSLSNKPFEKPSSPLTAGKTKATLEPAAKSEADYEDFESENVDIVDKQKENFLRIPLILMKVSRWGLSRKTGHISSSVKSRASLKSKTLYKALHQRGGQQASLQWYTA